MAPSQLGPLARILLLAGLLAAPRHALSLPSHEEEFLPIGTASLDQSTLDLFADERVYKIAHKDQNVESGAPDCSGGSHSRYHALVCWLWNSQISLPDETVHEGILTIHTKDMKCTNFQVSSMSSASAPSTSGTKPKQINLNTNDVNPSIKMDLQGISATCTGEYDAGFGMSGNIVASVSSSDGPLHLQVDIASAPLADFKNNIKGNSAKFIHKDGGHDVKENPQNKTTLLFPSKSTVSSCLSNLLVHDVKFTGSASAKIIDLFSGTISERVTTALNGATCPLIQSKIETLLNDALHSAGMYVRSLILNSTPDYYESMAGSNSMDVNSYLEEKIVLGNKNSGAIFGGKSLPQILGKDNSVRWDHEMKFLKRVLLGLNNFVSDHLNEGIVLKILRKLSTWQMTTTADCEDCGFFFKGLNGMIHSLLNAFGSVGITIPEKIFGLHHNYTFNIPNYGEIILTAQSMKVDGLGNFTDLSLFRPVGENMLSSAISSTAGFNVSIFMDIKVKPADGGVFKGDALHESFELQFNISDFSFSSQSAASFDREMFNKLSIGSIKHGSYTKYENNRNILNCVFETLTSVAITEMNARINLDAMQVLPAVPASEASVSSLEENIDQLLNNVLQMILTEYPATTTETLTGMIDGPARDKVNSVLEDTITSTKKYPLHCVNVEIPNKSKQHPLAFDSSKAIILFDEVFNTRDTITAMNTFIDCIDSVVSSKNLLSGSFFNFSLGEVSFNLHDLSYENLSKVSELELLKPDIDPYHLKNSFGYGMCYANGDSGNHSCDKTSISFGIALEDPERGRIGNINVHTKISNLQVDGGTELKFDLNWLNALTIADLLARPQCLTLPATEFNLYGFNASVGMLELQLDVNLISEDGGSQFYTYQTEDSIELAHVISALLSKGAVWVQEVWGDSFISNIVGESNTCTTPVNPNRKHAATHSKSSAGFFTFIIVLVFVAGNAWLILRGMKKDDDKGEISYDALHSQEVENDEVVASEEQEFTSLTEPLIDNQDEMNEVLEVDGPPRKFPLASSSSLMFHPSINVYFKYGFPAILALAIVLFLTSNFSVGASVDLMVTKANGESVTSMINIYTFSLGSTMREMLNAGVYMLMLLILFCSGFWPYIKIVLMAYSWMASTRRLPPIKREKILHLLDSLGKFSLIDAYVLVLMMVAFRYQLEVAEVGALNVYVTPKFGFYSFLFATIVSLISGHAMLFFHRRTMLPSIPVYSGRYESLSRHIFDDKHGRGLVRLTKKFRRVIVLSLFIAFLLIIIGSFLPCFHFKFDGVAGTAIGDSRIREFSLVSIGQQIPQSVQDSSSFGIHWIQTCYFFFALVMPLLCLSSLFVLFIIPLTMKQQQKIFVIAEVANAWGAIEVFLIAIVASLIEIAPFSESMVGERCGLVDKILSGWSGGDGNGLDHCFGVKSSIDGRSTVLIIGVILNSLLISTLHRFSHQAIWERIEREDRPNATEDESKNVRECVQSHTFLSKIRKSRLGAFMFEDVSFGPHSEYEIDFENVAEENDEQQSANFWSEWRKIVSVI